MPLSLLHLKSFVKFRMTQKYYSRDLLYLRNSYVENWLSNKTLYLINLFTLRQEKFDKNDQFI